MLRIIGIERDGSAEGRQTVLDHHYFCLIGYGKCVYWADHQHMLMEKGDLLILPPRVEFKWERIPSVFHSKHIVRFHVDPDFTGLPILTGNRPVRLHTGRFEFLHELLKSMESQWTEKLPYCEVEAAATFAQALVHINRELDKGPVAPEKLRYAEMMKRYIHEHYRNKITKEVLADVIRKSPNYTATLFKSVTGQTISEYVHAVRIKTAIYLLAESRLTIAELSEFLGYSDVSYFSRVFKQITGTPPSAYKQDRASDS
jgi:AraC family transcriptional regulator of arabinose operon